ncbi:MAG: T9SS type A sorting domain-containing protein [Chitinophagales bacterium]|nr:T9SS type A sorting domain-containing protein [Chitinophagales bacterium]
MQMKTTYSFLFSLVLGFAYSQSNQNLHFDGIDDYVMHENAASYINNSNTISMTGWFYSDILRYGSGMMGIRGLGTGSGNFYVLQLANGKLECRLTTTNGTFDAPSADNTIVTNQWQHIAMVYDGVKVETFINGISTGTRNATGNFVSSDKPFGIGKSLASGYNFVYQGRADEVTLWSKALTQAEIQDMMVNELVGNEANLELYYKFDQGYPNQNNTSITKLKSEIGGGTRDADLYNLELLSDSSNFGGSLDPGTQAISFPAIPNKVSVEAPFILDATASSGLAVSFEVISGPATVQGNVLSLSGQAGEVWVKAKQLGNASYSPAEELSTSFLVIDPNNLVADIDIRNPLNAPFYSPSLDPIELAAIVDIAYPELFNVSMVEFYVDGEKVGIKSWGNKHYTSLWTPTNYGTHTFEVVARNNYGASTSTSVNFELTSTISDINLDAFNDLWLDVNVGTQTVTAELPSFVGAFDLIDAELDIVCPPGGCDPWDRVSHVYAKGHNGEWYEIIRYLTPYGVACTHQIDLSDFMALLQGKIDFKVALGTAGNGFEYNLNLDYRAGIPNQKYSQIEKLWNNTYDFGNYSNLQPCEILNVEVPINSEAATIKLVSTGHGWDVNYNTGNAAEFHEDTHHLWVDGSQTFTQHNWLDCNPNPDACSPQAGTWQYDRAGWCPGSIAPWFTYDMSPYISGAQVELKYIFNENYVDLCHPNHPDCVTGVTCANCNQGFNPHLIVSSALVFKSNTPFNSDTTYTNLSKPLEKDLQIYLYPNPSAGKFIVELEDKTKSKVNIYDYLGAKITALDFYQLNSELYLDISNQAKGLYIIEVIQGSKNTSRKLILE